MAEISFYVLPTAKESARLGLVLKLVEKAYEAREPTYLLFDDKEFMNDADRAIWGMRDNAFIPHTVLTSADDIDALDLIYLSAEEFAVPNRSLLINLSRTFPTRHTEFQRIFEIITKNPDSIQISRNRYREYRDLGYEIKTHIL